MDCFEIDVRGALVVGERRVDLDWVPNRPERVEFPVNVETPPFDEAGELTLRELTFRVGVERLSDSAKDAFQVSIPLVDDRKRVTLRSIKTLTTGVPVLLPRVDEPYRPGTLRRRFLVSDQFSVHFFRSFAYGSSLLLPPLTRGPKNRVYAEFQTVRS